MVRSNGVAAPDVFEPPAPGRALVAVHSESAAEAGRRPAAAFLAHLIATEQHELQTREHRRAKPSEARHAYETALTPSASTTGRKLSRMM